MIKKQIRLYDSIIDILWGRYDLSWVIEERDRLEELQGSMTELRKSLPYTLEDL